MKSFDRPAEIFENEEALRDEWQPNELLERENELDAYHSALSPVIRGAPPKNIFIYGKTGVGKTVATELLLEQLESDADRFDDLDVTSVTLQCNSLNSSYQVATHLVNELRPSERPISTTGYPQQTVFNFLWDELERIGGTVIIVLDEIDNIGTDDDILYELPRARANGYVENVKLGVVGISNDFEFRDNLSPKVKDTLCDDEIEFSPYNANELQTILDQRAQFAFQPDVLACDTIPLCAAFAAQDTGSARQAIRLLYKAGEVALECGDKRVNECHVREAEAILRRKQIERGMRNLTTHGHVVLSAVTIMEMQNDTPARTREIYPEYHRMAKAIDLNPLVERRIRDHLRELSLCSVLELKEHNDGYREGSYFEYQLNTSTNTVVNVLSEIDRLMPIISPIKSKYS
ncbi:orc1/cdc6 family replication initiation protein [Haladaptatus sp. SPP-AMP-3]|uniref:orc1/cdc6 family replication initiation protein n=1 Tax=Haladaptatus sp. SPP-AMP-3 TaxID=3121295 RepID=UPI003C2E3841